MYNITVLFVENGNSVPIGFLLEFVIEVMGSFGDPVHTFFTRSSSSKWVRIYFVIIRYRKDYNTYHMVLEPGRKPKLQKDTEQ